MNMVRDYLAENANYIKAETASTIEQIPVGEFRVIIT